MLITNQIWWMLKFRKYKKTAYLSAKKHVGIEELVEMIRSHIYKEYTKCEMLIPYDGQVVSYFNNHAHVLSTSYENEGTKLEVECKTSDYEKYKRFAI